MADYRQMWGLLQGAANQTARSQPWLGVPAILSKPIVEAGLAGLGWGAGATKAAASGYNVDPAPSLYNMVNIYGLGGPAGGLTSGGMKAAPWFSALGRAIEAAPLKQAPGQQWLGTIKNMPGVKPEELEWTGFQNWLSNHPGALTKQEATDFLNQNKVDVQEVVKGQQPDWLRLKQEQDAASRAYFGGDEGAGARLDAANAALDEATVQATEGRPKFEQYQLPGGENYRELLLTLPRTESPKLQAMREELEELVSQPASVKTWAGEDRTAAFDRLQKEFAAAGGTPTRPTGFKSGHYDEPNVLAHVRFNDRVDAQGKKTLFLEEIQSDWHQKGSSTRRKEIKRLMAAKGITKEQAQAQVPEDFGYNTGEKQWAWIDRNGDAVEFMAERPPQEAIDIIGHNSGLRLEQVQKNADGVPDAPFKSSWPELSLKRMIKWAVDNGYDQIAWTPGKVQAERYDLSKQVQQIYVVPRKDGTFDIEAYPVSGRSDQVIMKQSLTEAQLADHIGKDAAERAIKKIKENPNEEAVLEGDDLKVGGEGMKGFYDKMLVNAANKLGKKYGAKVGVTKVGGNVEIVPTGGMYAVHLNGKEVGIHETRGAAQELVDELLATNQGGVQQEVWSLPITDAMRKEVGEKGLPLFSGGKGGSLAAILNQALTGDNGESLGELLSRSLKK